jgi:hypothetical protein
MVVYTLGLGPPPPPVLLLLSAVFRLNRLTFDQMLFTMHVQSCVQGNEWLVPVVKLMHTWVCEDKCTLNPL